jgi:hypothetical protein
MSANTSHLMKTTRRGRPFVKVSADVSFEVGLRKAEEIGIWLAQDTHDLFATLIVSLRLENHRSLFKVYPNSFST